MYTFEMEGSAMNYEDFYNKMHDIETKLTETSKNIGGDAKNISKYTENGDVKALRKNLDALDNHIQSLTSMLNELKAQTDAFDEKAYVSGGDLEEQLLEECRNKGIDVRMISTQVYDMFPSKVTVSRDTQEIVIDKKKQNCCRPKTLAETIAKTRDKLMKENFNAARFLEDMEKAYDVVIRMKNKKSDQAYVNLTDVYKQMVPMARSQKEYDSQAYAFDVARLELSDTRIAKDGRAISFNPSKDNKNAIRFLDSNGTERYLALVAFVRN